MIVMEDYDDWNDQSCYGWSTFTNDIENQIATKLNNDDYFIRKQSLSEALIYLQSPSSALSVKQVLEAVKGLSKDYEASLRTDLAESLITIHRFCGIISFEGVSIGNSFTDAVVGDSDVTGERDGSSNVNNWSFLCNFLIPTILAFLNDQNKQVRVAAHSSLIHFIQEQVIDEETFSSRIFHALEEIMNNCNPDEMRSEGFALLVQISIMLNNCLESNILEYCRDLLSTNDNLRKSCASHLNNIINHSSDSLINDWLDVYYKLAEDNSWYVRKFCIESSSSLSKRINKNERWTKLTDTYHNFMVDTKKWVFTAALQHLGQFIATFNDSEQTQCYLDEMGNVMNRNSGDGLGVVANVAGSSKYDSFQFWHTPVDENVLCNEMNEMGRRKEKVVEEGDGCGNDDADPDPDDDRNLYKLQDIVPHKLIQCYMKIIEEHKDMDILKPCAFSMPAILYTLGPQSWSYMNKPYFTLLHSMSWKVRLSLASSLHHIHEIFKYNKEAQDGLIHVFKEFIHDVDEIKVGLMENMSRFLIALPIDRLVDIFDDNDISELVHTESVKNWRYRVSCMEQFGEVVRMISVCNTNDDMQLILSLWSLKWLPVIFRMIQDPVSAVRLSAIDVILKILIRLSSWSHDGTSANNTDAGTSTNIDECRHIIIKQMIDCLATSPIWYLRQLYLIATTQIILNNSLPQSIIRAHLLPLYFKLCLNDPVPNNRMIGGKGLTKLFLYSLLFNSNESVKNEHEVDEVDRFHEVCRNLKNDPDRDVRHSVKSITLDSDDDGGGSVNKNDVLEHVNDSTVEIGSTASNCNTVPAGELATDTVEDGVSLLSDDTCDTSKGNVINNVNEPSML